MEKIKERILERYPDLEQLMDDYTNAQLERTKLGRFHEFSVGVRVGAQLMIEMPKEL
ncbi:MAG: hypothetical protein HDT21_02385 [Ruminococcus sp.]|nr:hypothetical protein [Ruminococcus sp.]